MTKPQVVAGRTGSRTRFSSSGPGRQARSRWAPSRRRAARLRSVMVKLARPDPAGYTLEIGPGTGVVTQALIDAGIPAERIVSVEYDKDFCRHLQKRFPRHARDQGRCARPRTRRSANSATSRFSAALSGIPLLNLPKKKRAPYLESILDRLVPGGVVSQLSYSLDAAAGSDPRPPRRRQVEMGDVQPSARAGLDLSPAVSRRAALPVRVRVVRRGVRREHGTAGGAAS